MSGEDDNITDVRRGVVGEIHRPARVHYNTRHVYVKSFKDLFQTDLIEMRPYSHQNSGYNYILVVIDAFSKYAWARPLKNKTALENTKAMRDILTCSDGTNHLKPPRYLQSDHGTEYYNKPMKTMLKNEFGIKLYSSYGITKCNMAERLNRTLKSRIWKEFSARGNHKWVKLLPKIMHNYNHTVHRTIKMKPAEVRPSDESKLRLIHMQNHLAKNRGKIRFKVGDLVRISKNKGVFEKGYLPNWSCELFKIAQVLPTQPVTYKLKDLINDAEIRGCFYNEEISKTSFAEVYLVEKVLKKRGNKVLVKWLGFPKAHNSWVLSSDIV